MTLGRPSYSSFFFLCYHVLLAAFHTTSHAALSSHPVQALSCSTSGNYTSASAYAANLNQFLATLPEETVSKNGGFFNGTVGEGPDTVYGLAMCSADYSRSDCGDCLAATATSSDTKGLPNRCPGSTSVVALFDPCLVGYSDTNFFGTAEIGAGSVYKLCGASVSVSGDTAYSDSVEKSLKEATASAVTSPERFSASSSDPYTLVQCTWDMPPDQCKRCLDVLSNNATEANWFTMTIEGKRKSYSCTVMYSNTSFVVVPFGGAPTPHSVDQATTPTTQSSGTAGKGSLTIGVVGSVVGVILLACLAAWIWKVIKLRSKRDTRGLIPTFSYQELVSATDNFAATRKLGNGAFGVVYRGRVKLQGKELDVAVKKDIDATKDVAAFYKEVDIMGPLNHGNVIRLVGLCKEKKNLMLVYELVDGRNLEDRLYGRGARVDAELAGARAMGSSHHLDWPKRYNILFGIASGLEYRHAKCTKCVLHRDIKPANVMLDGDFNAKLCDFGLVTQLTHAVTSRSTDNVIGTQGYLDPAYQTTGKVTRESDVYSFGVLLLEVVCGVAPKLTGNPAKNTLIDMVQQYDREGRILKSADQSLMGREFDEEIKGALSIGLCCVETRRGDRPTIQIVVARLLSLAPGSTSGNPDTSEASDQVLALDTCR